MAIPQFRTWLMFGMMSASFLSLHAQQVIKEKQVPQEIRDDFGLRFQTAENIVWLKSGEEHFGARYKMNGANAEVVYGASDGQWVQTTQEIAYTEMPDKAKAFCKEKYADYVAQKVEKVSTRRYGILYEMVVAKEQEHVALTFDMHGKLLEENKMEAQVSSDDATSPSAKEKLTSMFKKQD